jgi:beta-lysine 5,6-aminomutase alpha subunit
MAYRKLNLDRDRINQCRESARRVVKPVQKYIDRHSTLAIESATLTYLGAENMQDKRPVADLIITKLDRDRMRRGISYWFGRALIHTKLQARDLAHKIADGRITFESIPDVPGDQIRDAVTKLAVESSRKMNDLARARKACTEQFSNLSHSTPILMVSPENTHELKQFLADEHAGIILFGDIRRFGLHLEEQRTRSCGIKRFGVGLSGLETPKHALYSLSAGADIIAKDTLSDIFLHEINVKRALVDAHFARRLCSRFCAVLYSEGSHVRHLDAYRDAHELVASQFIEEAFCEHAAVPPELFAVGHAFDVDPLMDEGFLHELARAALMRELYPRNLLVYLPPSKFCLDKPLSCTELNAIFELAASVTEQSVVASPLFKNKFEMLQTAALVLKNSRTLGDEIQFYPNGKIARRAATILENTAKMLKKIELTGLLEAMAKGIIAEKAVDEKGGSGLEGVFQKERDYFNPVEILLQKGAQETYCVEEEKPAIKPAEQAPAPSHPKPHRFHRGRRRRHPRFKGHAQEGKA